MKLGKKLLCLLAALCLLLSAAPAARAEEAEGDARFADKTWEQITEDFILAHHAENGTVTIGYYNTVSGEEAYWNRDEYMISGSLFKVPLNMIFCERIARGDMDWSTSISGYSYEYLLNGTLIDSNNEQAEILWREAGKGTVRPYRTYREIIAPYMGEDPETADDMYYKNNYFTAGQMLHCLKLLYTEQERFPRILDTMKKAEPHKYFLQDEQKVEVAHKYGYWAEGSVLYLNDCGVCYTEDPFCLVVFTAGIVNPGTFLTEYCALMIDYTEYQTALRHEEEMQRAREEAIQAMNPTQAPTVTAEMRALSAEGSLPEAPEGGAAAEEAVDIRTPVLSVVLFGLVAASLATLLKLGKKKQLKLLWALPALVFAAAALALCLYAPAMKPAVTVSASAGEERADPQDCVRLFFDSLIRKDYATAYDCLYDYASLGLEERPEGEAARLMAEALTDSYSYSLYGDCETQGLSAKQQVILEMLDLNALQDDLKAGTEARVLKLSEELPRSQLLDENGEYLPEITRQAYLDTLRELLSHPARYRTSVGLDLELSYTVKGWRILTDNALIQALGGRAARGGDGA